MQPLYKKNDVVICPQCASKIMRVVRDLFWGERIDAGLFDGISQEIINGDRTDCKKCGANYYEQHRFKIIREVLENEN